MEWNLVNQNSRLKKLDFVFIVLCFIGLIVLIYLRKYYILNNKSYNNSVTIYSNYLIDNDKLDIDYHLVYPDIKTSFNDLSISMNYYSLSNNDIIFGRMYISNFEVILSEKHKSLLNKYISIKIHDQIYKFKVVGIYKHNSFIHNDFIYTNLHTLEQIYHDFSFYNYYNYIFVVDDFWQLNDEIDKLHLKEYKVFILINENFNEISNYKTIIDVFSFLIFILIVIILIIIFYRII